MKLPEEVAKHLREIWQPSGFECYETIVRDCAEAAADIAANCEATKVTQKFIQNAILARYGLAPPAPEQPEDMTVAKGKMP